MDTLPENPKLAATEAHHAFIRQLDETADKFRGHLAPDERLAIVAQFLGQLIYELPDHYDPQSVMVSVGKNMEAGNKGAADRGKRPGLLVQ